MHKNAKQSETICRVCGLNEMEERWELYGNELFPKYFICSCCGVEAGLEDSWLEGIKRYRKEWLGNGNKWRYPKSMPENWNLEKQLAQIPKKYC